MLVDFIGTYTYTIGHRLLPKKPTFSLNMFDHHLPPRPQTSLRYASFHTCVVHCYIRHDHLRWHEVKKIYNVYMYVHSCIGFGVDAARVDDTSIQAAQPYKPPELWGLYMYMTDGDHCHVYPRNFKVILAPTCKFHDLTIYMVTRG